MTDLRTETKAKLENLLERLPIVRDELHAAIDDRDGPRMKAAAAEWKTLMEDQREVIRVACALRLIQRADYYLHVKQTLAWLKGAYPADKYPTFPAQVDCIEVGLTNAFENESQARIDWWIEEALTLPLPAQTTQRLGNGYGRQSNPFGLAPQIQRMLEERPRQQETP